MEGGAMVETWWRGLAEPGRRLPEVEQKTQSYAEALGGGTVELQTGVTEVEAWVGRP